MFKQNLRLLLLFVAIAGYAGADQMTWYGPNGTNWAGFYTSPYYVDDTSKTPAIRLTLFCLDFNDEIAPPTAWVANIRDLNSDNVTSFAQFGGHYDPNVQVSFPVAGYGDAYTRYKEAAWLFTQIEAFQAQGDTASMIMYQVAAWELFVDSSHIVTLTNDIGQGQFRADVDHALAAAQTAVNGTFTGAGWSLVTGDLTWVNDSYGGKHVQEFLTPIPEPSAVVLLVTVAGFLATARRRRRGQSV